MSLARAIATVGGLTLLSRVAGFLRDMLSAALVGWGPEADAFVVALKLPNLLRKLSGEGAFSAGFVPMFAGLLQTRGREVAVGFAEQALAGLVAVLLPVTIAAVWFMPAVIGVLAPGFRGQPQTFALAVDLARLAFPYLMLISLAALMGGVLNALDRFAPFAAAPIVFNLTLIAALGLARPLGLAPVRAMGWGVAMAGVLQLVWMAAACRAAGVRLRLPRPRGGPLMRRLAALMAPGVAGTGVVQVSLMINLMIASLLPAGIALATGITAWLHAGLLAWRCRLGTDRRLRGRIPGIVASCIGLAAVLHGLRIALAADSSTPIGLIILVFAGFCAFGFLALLTRAVRLTELRALF
jgi:putative peptidoglycan lipid II flippase